MRSRPIQELLVVLNLFGRRVERGSGIALVAHTVPQITSTLGNTFRTNIMSDFLLRQFQVERHLYCST